MRISSKGRYGLASMIYLSQQYDNGECVTVLSISEKLKISKIYLEQVFSLLKHAGLVTSVKGAQGGYQLSKSPNKITACDILHAIEASLFEKTVQSVLGEDDTIEKAMRGLVFDQLDSNINDTLDKVTLSDLVSEVEMNKKDYVLMFYI